MTKKASIQAILSDRALLYHHLEWVLMHPRFGLLMIGLIALSFTHDPGLALALFVLFACEIGLRIAIMAYKVRTNPYRSSLNRKFDGLFLLLDIIGAASLLITVFDLPLDAGDAAAARLLRAAYLLRTLRFFRYIDLQSLMYSPTYGMFISVVILLSFFATDTLQWIIIIFFFVELAIRMLIMRNMTFESRRDRIAEWGYWWIDLIATIVMIPALSVIPYGGGLRMLRLIRLLRPWMVILRNLREVMREGQFLQEINLIVLLLGVLSVGFGVVGYYTLDDFDFTQDGRFDPKDRSLLATIWFSFRLFTDPGNSVTYPANTEVAVISVIGVVVGVFLFAFFIGIGASIVSGLMAKLRNERLNITNHMVMLGWSEIAPFVLERLHTISERSFSRLKLVLLHDERETPPELLEHSWVSHRQGDFTEVESLHRINLAHARQGIVNLDCGKSGAENMAEAMFALLAIRRVNPDIYLNYTTPGNASPRLAEHHHMLQIGWDTTDFYNKPTVIQSIAEVRANMLRNVVVYRDFDQVMERLMIPERTEESALQICEWDGHFTREDGRERLSLPDADDAMDIPRLAARLMMRGATLLALVDEQGQAHPLYRLHRLPARCRIRSLLGIAINANALHAETYYTIRHLNALPQPAAPAAPLAPVEQARDLRLLIIGWVGSLPLLLKRLLDDFETLHVTIVDQLDEAQFADQTGYLRRRFAEMPGANERIRLETHAWNFDDMNLLRPWLQQADRVLLSRPLHLHDHAYALIATTLSHMVTLMRADGLQPEVFPILDNREQARLLQEELERFDTGLEIHVTVPNEFFGAYAAHTAWHMYACEDADSYEMQRTLRHVIDDLMGDVGESDDMDIHVLRVTGELPEDAEALFHALLAQGMVWIGYRMQSAFEWRDPVQDAIRKFFPREGDFRCLRQHQIIINPFGNPISRHSWLERREEIVELILIGASLS